MAGVPCKELKWAYGVTTVPSRRRDLLPRTLASLKLAGFDHPRLFIDGAGAAEAQSYADQFSLEVTNRDPIIRTFGNWILALAEMWIREPQSDRFAVFQDDFVTYKNLRKYLDATPYPDKGYLNLYTFPSNQEIAPVTSGFYQSRTMPEGQGYVYHGQRMQMGRGAVALIFNRDAVIRLLTSYEHIVERPLAHGDSSWKRVDGGVVTAMNKAGFREYVHNPSLVQHTGKISSMRNKEHLLAPSFRGEDFDAMALLVSDSQKSISVEPVVQ